MRGDEVQLSAQRAAYVAPARWVHVVLGRPFAGTVVLRVVMQP